MTFAHVYWRGAKSICGEHARDRCAFGQTHDEQVFAVGFANAGLREAQLNASDGVELFCGDGREINGHVDSKKGGLKQKICMRQSCCVRSRRRPARNTCVSL